MGNANQASLGAIRLQAKQRSDMENNPAVSDSEWNSYITQSYKELTDLLVAAYGNDYRFATPYQFTTSNSQYYPLPDGTNAFINTAGSTSAKFYKLLGVDLQYSASPTGWVSLQRFEFIERNKWANPNMTTNLNGYTNLRYRLEGDQLFLTPMPMSGQTCQVWYIPAPRPLQYLLPCRLTQGSLTINFSGGLLPNNGTEGLVAGMSVYGDGIPSGATIGSVNTTASRITLGSSSFVTQSIPAATVAFWSDAAVMDGIAGWEEYIIVDSAIKAKIKQEEDISALLQQKLDMKQRIEAMSEGRDAGQAMHVSDTLSINGCGSDGFGGFGSGGWGI